MKKQIKIGVGDAATTLHRRTSRMSFDVFFKEVNCYKNRNFLYI